LLQVAAVTRVGVDSVTRSPRSSARVPILSVGMGLDLYVGAKVII